MTSFLLPQDRDPSTIAENSWGEKKMREISKVYTMTSMTFLLCPQGPWSEHDSAELLRLPAAVRSLPLLLWLLRVPQSGDDPPQRGRHRRAPTQQVLDVSFFCCCCFDCLIDCTFLLPDWFYGFFYWSISLYFARFFFWYVDFAWLTCSSELMIDVTKDWLIVNFVSVFFF